MRCACVLLVLFGTVLNGSHCDAHGNQLPPHKWNDTLRFDSVPERHQHEDAVMTSDKVLYSLSRTTAYSKYGSRPPYSELVTGFIEEKRIRILRPSGIQYGRIIVPKHKGEIVQIGIRVLKKNGNLLDYPNSKLIYENEDTDKLIDTAISTIYSVPGIEEGDEVQTFLELTNYYMPFSIYMHRNLSVLHSELRIMLPNYISRTFGFYKGFSRPVIENNGSDSTFIWRISELPGLNVRNSIWAFEVPHLTIAIRGYTRRRPNWADAYYYVLGKSENPHYSIKEFINKVCGDLPPNDILSRMTRLHNYINDNIIITNYIDPNYASADLGYFVNKKHMTPDQVFNLYRNLLEAQAVYPLLIMAKSKYAGQIDTFLATTSQITTYLVGFQDSMGSLHYIMPKYYHTTHEIDEIPVNIQNTVAIIVPGIKEDYTTVLLPRLNSEANIISAKALTDISLSRHTISQKYRRTYIGNPSTSTRNYYINWERDHILKDKINTLADDSFLRIDSANIVSQSHDYPYTFKMNYAIRADSSLTDLKNGTYQIDLKGWFRHKLENAGRGLHLLDYYPSYTYTDRIQFYLVFDKKIDTLTALPHDEISFPEIGSYHFNVSRINDTTLTIESEYNITSRIIEKDDIKKLLVLNTHVKDAGLSTLLIKLKN